MPSKTPTVDTLDEEIEISKWVKMWIGKTARIGRASGRNMKHTIPRYKRQFTRYIDWLKATGQPLTPKELSGIAGGHILEDFFDFLRDDKKDDKGQVIEDSGNGNSTVAVYYRTFNTFFKWAIERSASDDSDTLPPHVRLSPCNRGNKPDDSPAAGISMKYHEDEFKRMLAAAGKDGTESIWKLRNRALMLILRHTGLRRVEVAGLRIADYDTSTGKLVVRETKRTKSGQEPRTVAVFNGVRAEIDYYIGALRDYGMDKGPLFPSPRRNGNGVQPVAPAGINLIVSGLAHGLQDACDNRAAHRDPADDENRTHETGCEDCIRWTTVHRWRHTWATESLLKGYTEADVMTLGGWANIAMLDRYVKEAKPEIAHKNIEKIENDREL